MRNLRLEASFILVAALLFPIPLKAGCNVVTINPPTIPNGIAASSYSQMFTQSGLAIPTWSLTGVLPNGMNFSSPTATLSGTPMQTGSYPITVTATEGGCSGSRDYTLFVGCQTITFGQTVFAPGRLGFGYNWTIGQSGGIGSVTYSLSITPPGLNFNTGSSQLSGIPSQEGAFYPTLTVTDSNGCHRSGQFPIGITNANGLAGYFIAFDPTGNTIFDPGETIVVRPSWANNSGGVVTLSGNFSNFSGPAPATYTINDNIGNYGSIANNSFVPCTDCYSLSVSAQTRPAPHWDASVTESINTNQAAKVWTVHIGDSFTDVPQSFLFYRYVETLFHSGVTSGCAAGVFCPTNPVTRDQMAVFVLRSMEGGSYNPPPATGTVFNDVPLSYPFAAWIEELARRGVVAGCGNGNYCPGASVTRGQMSAFLLRTLEGTAYNPPACTGQFSDVPPSYVFCPFIEQLAARGITSGCGSSTYCPNDPITRQQMAVFLVRTFKLDIGRP